MATSVNFQIVGGEGQLAYHEVSGGRDGMLEAGSYDCKVGADGAVISFLTIRREKPCVINITAKDGSIDVEFDGKEKRLKKGSSSKFPAKAKRAFIKEHVKH